MKILILSILLTSCHAYKWCYSKAKIIHRSGKIEVIVTGKFKELPDTIMDVFIIRKR